MKKTITILAVALMALSACNKEGGRMPGMTEYIAFESYAGGMTKTAALNTANLSTFGAAAYTGSVEIMNNQLVEGGNGAWDYTPIKYWPQSGALYFSAYAPYATASNGITPTYNTATKSFDLSYVMPADEADQVDLLMAQNVDVADCSNRPAKVQFTFGHILSRIGLTARYTGNVSAGTTVTLTDVKISGKFMASGDYTVSGGWANQVASASTVIYDRPAAKLAATALTTTAQGLLAGDNYVMVIPNGSVAMEGTITVYYTITSPDGVSMEYVKDASSPLNYEPNKTYMYNLIIDLDADAIEFGDVTVLDWGTEVSQDVEVRSYSNRLSVSGLGFSTTRRTAEYTVTSIREYDDGEIEQIPWHAEFSTDGGSTYSETVPEFFETITTSDIESGTYSATSNADVGSTIDIKFIQDIAISPFDLDTPKEENVSTEVQPTPLTFEIVSGGTIKWVAGSNSTIKTIYYRINDGEWKEIRSGIETQTTAAPFFEVNTGDIVQFKASNTKYSNASYYDSFRGTATYNVYGNIMSLVDEDNYENLNTMSDGCFMGLFEHSNAISASELKLPSQTSSGCYKYLFRFSYLLTSPPVLPAEVLSSECYASMFSGCRSLSNCPELPAMTLAPSCYSNMFNGCTSLTSAPELPAMELTNLCYNGMFYGCSSLQASPELPATSMAEKCYMSMFYGCTSLTDPPQVLPAETLALGCYEQMFTNCTSLISSPELPSVTLEKQCYETMFKGCSSLVTAPELPATELKDYCYAYMFQNCTSLQVAPELPAPTLPGNCYSSMFKGCSTLSQIKCLAVEKAGTSTSLWLSGVAEDGLFIKDPSATWTTGAGGTPIGWTVQDAQ